MKTEEVEVWRAAGYYPHQLYAANAELRAVIDLIREGFFSRGDRELFRPIVEELLQRDPYFLLADYQSYVDCQAHVDAAYQDKEQWSRMSILNTARSGLFSSDRTIREYCDDIWRVKPVTIELPSIGVPNELFALAKS